MANWRERLTQFMQGRYGGNDTFNKALFGVFLFFLLLAIFHRKNRSQHHAESDRSCCSDLFLLPDLLPEYCTPPGRKPEVPEDHGSGSLPVRQEKRRQDTPHLQLSEMRSENACADGQGGKSRSPVRTAAISSSSEAEEKRCTGIFGHTNRKCGFGNTDIYHGLLLAVCAMRSTSGTAQLHAGR